MKKKILTLGAVLVLVTVLVLPTAALAVTTEVTGAVTEGYVFTAPSPILLGTMALGATATGNSAGLLLGNDPDGYTVDGIDVKGSDTGYMVSGVGDRLGSKHQISWEDDNYVDADIGKTFVDTSTTTTNAPFSLFVQQAVVYNDPVAAYTITITFTVSPKT